MNAVFSASGRRLLALGGAVVKTASTCDNGAELCLEAYTTLKKRVRHQHQQKGGDGTRAEGGLFDDFDVIVQISCDEPFIQPHHIEMVANIVAGSDDAVMGTLARRGGDEDKGGGDGDGEERQEEGAVTTTSAGGGGRSGVAGGGGDEWGDDVVRCALDDNGYALYFFRGGVDERQPPPPERKRGKKGGEGTVDAAEQSKPSPPPREKFASGIYGYRADFLPTIVKLPKSEASAKARRTTSAAAA